jgi:hypothetical protein
MTPHSPEVEILLGFEGAFRRVPLASLAAITRVPLPTLRESCSRLVLSLIDRNDESSPTAEGEPTEGEARNVRFGNVSNVRENTENETFVTSPNERTDAPARDTEPAPAADESNRAMSGEWLAHLLDDEDSRAFYDQLVAATTPATIARALDLTLTRRSTIRGRPAAYFTALVRRLAAPHPYA